MAVININAIGIGPELISGVPQFVSLTTNVPATIFYTIDGSVPTVVSNVYVGEIIMPTSGTIRLRALAISGMDSGILDLTFSTDISDLRSPRRGDATHSSGVVVDAYNKANEFFDGYGLDAYGNSVIPISFHDEYVGRFDLKLSETDSLGRPPGLILSIGLTPSKKAVVHGASTPNGNNIYFNPRALYITIDGRDGYQDQIQDGYRIINRPFGSTVDSAKFMHGKLLTQSNPHITGGFVRTLYSLKNKTAVSYYFDHVDSRWVKSIQPFDPSTVPANIGLRRHTGGPIVFKWVHNRRTMI